MSKPLNKGGTERPATPTIKIPPGTHYQMRAATQTTGNAKPATIQSGTASIPPRGTQSSKEKETENSNTLTKSSNKQKSTTIQTIVKVIHMIIDKDKPDRKVRASLEDLLKFISDVEEKENKRAESTMAQPEVSTLYKAIKQDLSKMHKALAKQIDSVLGTTSTTLKNSEKSLADNQNLKKMTKEIFSRVGKVNNATDRIASNTQTYRDVLAQNPAVPSKFALDPKVLRDMEHRA